MGVRSTRTDTADRILDLAERLVQTRGFNGFSYADVAGDLGVTARRRGDDSGVNLADKLAKIADSSAACLGRYGLACVAPRVDDRD